MSVARKSSLTLLVKFTAMRSDILDQITITEVRLKVPKFDVHVWSMYSLSRIYINSCNGCNQRQSFLLQISKMHECIPRCAIDKFVELCVVCHPSNPQSTRSPLKPIIPSGFMTRGQIGTIYVPVVCCSCLPSIGVSYSLSCVNVLMSDQPYRHETST